MINYFILSLIYNYEKDIINHRNRGSAYGILR